MSETRRQWAQLPLEKKLGIVVVPIAVAVIGVTVPLLSGTDDDGTPSSRAAASTDESPFAIGYRKDVGAVCEHLSAAQQRRRRDAVALRERLRRARTTAAQRNAIIDDTQRTLDRFTGVYTELGGLTPPVAQRALHDKAAGAFKDSLTRLRAYRTGLEDGTTARRLTRALNRFKRVNGPAIEDNAAELRAALRRLGGSDCDIAPVKTVRVFTLPPVETPTPSPEPSPPPVATPGPTATAAPPPPQETIVPPVVPTPRPAPTPNPGPAVVPSPRPHTRTPP